jgi:molybdopterin-containing oxidoreductase family membrane subunit
MDTVSRGRREDLEWTVLRPLVHTGKGYWLVVGILLAVFCWGLFAYMTQLRDGLFVTGMRDRIFWGLYITLFVFFIGISHAGRSFPPSSEW